MGAVNARAIGSGFVTALALMSFASAQVQETRLELPASRLHRVTSPPREAGIYHLATGTWTRKASSALLGAEVIFDNTCPVGYFDGLSGDRFVNNGRLPSPTSPHNLGSRPGCATTYAIDGFQLGYCTDRTSTGSWEINFYESRSYCATAIGVTPSAALVLTQLPASSTQGIVTCWTVAIDLEAPPQQQSLAFAIRADGDGTYTPPETSNLFGWSIECSLPDAEQTLTGPMLGGHPNVCGRFDGTRWDDGAAPAWPNNLSESGTGMGTVDAWRVENGPTTPGCYFFGDWIAFHLELYADACDAPSGLAFCAGDGSGSACPCGNASAVGANEGCLNSFGIGAKLTTIGTSSLSNDSLVLVGSRMPANSSALYFQGTSRVNGGSGSTFGDGLRCAGGSVQRLGTTTNTSVGS